MVTEKSATTPTNIIPENTKNVNGDNKKIDDERKSVKRTYEVDSTGEERQQNLKETDIHIMLNL